MKVPILTIAAISCALLTPTVFAEDQPAGCKCEMMKKPEPAPAAEPPKCEMMKKPAPTAAAPAETSHSEAAAQQAELDKLVAEMNGNLGPKKVEAMAAIVTRLVEQSKAMQAAHGANPAPGGEAPKSEAHHH